jgi:hypothetical protein
MLTALSAAQGSYEGHRRKIGSIQIQSDIIITIMTLVSALIQKAKRKYPLQ